MWNNNCFFIILIPIFIIQFYDQKRSQYYILRKIAFRNPNQVENSILLNTSLIKISVILYKYIYISREKDNFIDEHVPKYFKKN